jgi:hypothetical protein
VVVSLTLAPTLAALFMRAPKHDAHAKPGFSEKLLAHYARGLRYALAHQRMMLGVFGLTLVLAVAGYVLYPQGLLSGSGHRHGARHQRGGGGYFLPDMVRSINTSRRSIVAPIRRSRRFPIRWASAAATRPSPTAASGSP